MATISCSTIPSREHIYHDQKCRNNEGLKRHDPIPHDSLVHFFCVVRHNPSERQLSQFLLWLSQPMHLDTRLVWQYYLCKQPRSSYRVLIHPDLDFPAARKITVQEGLQLSQIEVAVSNQLRHEVGLFHRQATFADGRECVASAWGIHGCYLRGSIVWSWVGAASGSKRPCRFLRRVTVHKSSR
jgi:hypothetical protein